MDDDFNTPQALAALFDLARDINQTGDKGEDIKEARAALKELGGVLGLRFPRIFNIEVTDGIRLTAQAEVSVIPKTIDPRITSLINKRLVYRKEKNWQKADDIRNKLTELGIILEDTKSGTDVTYKNVPSEEALEKLIKEIGGS